MFSSFAFYASSSHSQHRCPQLLSSRKYYLHSLFVFGILPTTPIFTFRSYFLGATLMTHVLTPVHYLHLEVIIRVSWSAHLQQQFLCFTFPYSSWSFARNMGCFSVQPSVSFSSKLLFAWAAVSKFPMLSSVLSSLTSSFISALVSSSFCFQFWIGDRFIAVINPQVSPASVFMTFSSLLTMWLKTSYIPFQFYFVTCISSPKAPVSVKYVGVPSPGGGPRAVSCRNYSKDLSYGKKRSRALIFDTSPLTQLINMCLSVRFWTKCVPFVIKVKIVVLNKRKYRQNCMDKWSKHDGVYCIIDTKLISWNLFNILKSQTL